MGLAKTSMLAFPCLLLENQYFLFFEGTLVGFFTCNKKENDKDFTQNLNGHTLAACWAPLNSTELDEQAFTKAAANRDCIAIVLQRGPVQEHRRADANTPYLKLLHGFDAECCKLDGCPATVPVLFKVYVTVPRANFITRDNGVGDNVAGNLFSLGLVWLADLEL